MTLNKSLVDLNAEISRIEDQLEDINHRTMISSAMQESTPKLQSTRADRDSGIGSAQNTAHTSSSSRWGGARPKVRIADQTAQSGDGSFSIAPDINVTQRRRILPDSRTVQSPTLAIGNGSATQSHTKRKMDIKPATFDGTSSWKDYKSHFDACAKINAWSIEEKGLFLAVSLRGQAQGVLGDLPENTRKHYDLLIKALEERFAPPNQTELYRVQLRERHQKATESLPELGQAIRRLVNQAYPTAPADVRETLAKDQFIDAFKDQEIRIKIKQSRPVNLNSAVQLAVELESYYRTEQKMKENYGQYRTIDSQAEVQTDAPTHNAIKDVKTMIESLKNELGSLKCELKEMKVSSKAQSAKSNQGDSKRNKNDIVCYKCGFKSHISRDCYSRRRKDGSKLNENKNGGQSRAKRLLRRAEQRNKQTCQLGIGSQTLEAGIYVKTLVNDEPAIFLIDTGASLSLVSSKLYDNLPHTKRPCLQAVTSKVLTAASTELPLEGKCSLNVKIDEIFTNWTFTVAELSIDGVFGMEFLKHHAGVVDIRKECLVLKDTEVPLVFQGPLGCYRIVASETVTIPPKSELLFRGKAIGLPEKNSFDQGFGLIEPTTKFIDSQRGLIARALVRVCNEVPLRAVNLSDDPQLIYSGTEIAEMSEVSRVLSENVIVYGRSFEEMLKNLSTVFDCLAKAGLKLKPKKCTLFSKEVHYLGHVVSEKGIATDQDKVSSVKNWPVPINVKVSIYQQIDKNSSVRGRF